MADCHSPELARRSCSPRRGRRRTNERTAGASASEPRGIRPVANSRQTGKLPVAFSPLQAQRLHDWLCVKDELASALAQVKRGRLVVGWQQTTANDCQMRWLASFQRTRQLWQGRKASKQLPVPVTLGVQGALLKRVYDGR